MLKLIKQTSLLVAVFSLMQVQAQTGTGIIKQMHKRYFNGPCRSYTFSQKNTHYRNDSITGHSEWHEAIEFPDKFRIDFGDTAEGNYVVFKHDSVFNFRKSKQLKMRPDSNTLLLLLGGMYYRSIDDVLARMKKSGYDLSQLSSQKWNNKEVYVIGARENDMTSNQLWVDKKTLMVERIIEKMNGKDIMDMRFEAHQAWCKGSVETKVSFRRNGKLEQVEEYYNIKESKGFPEQ